MRMNLNTRQLNEVCQHLMLRVTLEAKECRGCMKRTGSVWARPRCGSLGGTAVHYELCTISLFWLRSPWELGADSDSERRKGFHHNSRILGSLCSLSRLWALKFIFPPSWGWERTPKLDIWLRPSTEPEGLAAEEPWGLCVSVCVCVCGGCRCLNHTNYWH